MPLYSHSRLSSYENCPRQFQFRYVDKIKVETEGVEAFVGKRVHEILERLYHHLERYGRPPSLYKVQERFRQDWTHHWHENVRIVRDENDEGYYLDLGLRCLANYYRAHYPFDEGETIGIERPIQLQLDASGRYRLRGIIDRVVRREPGHYEIHDYKTGGWVPPRARLERDRQLALYQIGLEQQESDVEQVDLVWHYVQFDKTFRVRRAAEDLDALRGETIELIDRIEGASEFKPSTGPLCRWCEYQSLCPAGLEHTAGPGGPPGDAPPPPGDASPRPGETPLAARAQGDAPSVRFAGSVQLPLF